jgi:hypothetical protein
VFPSWGRVAQMLDDNAFSVPMKVKVERLMGLNLWHYGIARDYFEETFLA